MAFSDVIQQYREAREKMLQSTECLFPPGTRVQPIGTTTGNWGATVRQLDEHRRIHVSADMVWLDWDNGNSFPVRIDEIETFEEAKMCRVCTEPSTGNDRLCDPCREAAGAYVD